MAMNAVLSHWHPDSGEEPLEEITLGDLLARQAEQFTDRPALIFDEPDRDLQVKWSYAELNRHTNSLAKGLMAIGVKKGDRVAVLSPNRPEWVLLEYALARIGAVLITVNPSYRQAELSYLLAQGRVSVLFCTAEYRGFSIAQMLGEMLPELLNSNRNKAHTSATYPDLREIIVIGGQKISGTLDFDGLLVGKSDISDEQLYARSSQVQPRDVVQIQYTSGTTGKPKGAMLTHYGIINNAVLAGRRSSYTEADILVSAMPFFHTAGCVCNVIGMAAVGGCLVPLESFNAATMLDLVAKHKGTITNAVPTMYVRMLQDEMLLGKERDFSSWRIAYTGGTSIPASLMLELREKFSAEPAVTMGMTECSPIITQTVQSDALEKKVTSAGVPLPHVEIRIADLETGETTPTGIQGELLIRGFLITAGYFDMPERTAEAIDAQGWLHSGDIAVMEQGGYLRIVGRIKDMLIRGGENIYPAEIEDYLLEHNQIAEAQIIGVPDPEFGEEIYAFIVPKDGEAIDENKLRQWCGKKMARHKLPRYFSMIERMPQTANGKVRKVELREIADYKMRVFR